MNGPDERGEAGSRGPSRHVEVRSVRPDEFAAAGKLVVAAYRALPGAHLSGDYASELAAVGRRAREAEVLVAAERVPGGAPKLLGCATLVPDASSPWSEYLEDGEAGVRMLAVLPEAQGMGIGRMLVEACLARARELGKSALVLHTTPWMTTAHHLYETSGFARFPERDHTPVPEVPLLAYRHELP